MIAPDQLHAMLDSAGFAHPAALVVLGSGLGGCFAEHEVLHLYNGSDKSNAVQGHAGALGVYKRGSREALIAFGRKHLYQGATLHEVQQTVATAAALGVKNLILTNAAGGLNPLLKTGDILLVDGTVTMMFGPYTTQKNISNNPGPRDSASAKSGLFAHQTSGIASDAYPEIMAGGLESGVAVKEGTYASMLGPSYETRGEIRMLRRMGVDAVGMSTIPELTVATRLGIQTVVVSLITNVVSDTTCGVTDHLEVVQESVRAREKMRAIIDACLDVLGNREDGSQ